MSDEKVLLLHPVTGSAKFCAPCAWSALTGMSSDTWVDEPKTDAAEYYEFERQRFVCGAPWYVDPLGENLIGVLLAEFREPGRWALTLGWEDDDNHAVAVVIQDGRRVFADNNIRSPIALETVLAQHQIYRTAVIVGGVQLVPDHDNPFPFR